VPGDVGGRTGGRPAPAWTLAAQRPTATTAHNS